MKFNCSAAIKLATSECFRNVLITLLNFINKCKFAQNTSLLKTDAS